MKNFPQTMFRCVFNQDFNQDGSFNYEDFLYIHSPVWVQKLDSGLPPNGDPKIQYGSFRATWDYPLLNSAMQVQKVLTIRMDFRVTASKWSHYQDTIEYVNGRVDGFVSHFMPNKSFCVGCC